MQEVEPLLDDRRVLVESASVLGTVLEIAGQVDRGLGQLEDALAESAELGIAIPEPGQFLPGQIEAIDDAFTLFPEGGNFTPTRRERSITWLRREGRERRAASAERMRHVLAPRQAGTATALAAAPEADIAIVAHTGLEHLTSAKAMWRYMPMDTTIRVHWWKVPGDEAPRDAEAVGDWLFGWWSLVDGWIEANRPQVVDDALADPTTRTDPITP